MCQTGTGLFFFKETITWMSKIIVKFLFFSFQKKKKKKKKKVKWYDKILIIIFI
jgi:hypothetical protein